MPLANLHIHSTCSDGTLTPVRILQKSGASGLELVSITDHDTVSAWTENHLKGGAVRLLTGVEINTNYHDSFHILGYGIDTSSPRLSEFLLKCREKRAERAKKIIALLSEHGINIDFGALEADKRSVGRPHIADEMIRQGLYKDRKSAFFAFLAPGRPAYVPSMGPSPEEAIEAIKNAGGFAVLAHPGLVKKITDFGKLKNSGLDGIECYYPCHSRNFTAELIATAKKYSLLITGGTDFHGPGSGREEFHGYNIAEEFIAPLLEKVL